MDVNIENISNYSDQELFSVMKKLNLNVGPITGTTRKLYEKRLRTYLENLDSNNVNKENKNLNDKSKLNEQTTKKKIDKEQDKISTKVGDNNENRSIIKKKEKISKQTIAEIKANDSPSLITPIKHDKPIETPTTPHKKHEMVHIIQPQATSTSIHGHKINFSKPDEALDEDVFEAPQPQPQPQHRPSNSKITIEKVESMSHRNDETRTSVKSSVTETPVIHSHSHTHSTSNKVDSSILSSSSLYLKPNDTILKASPNVMNKFATRLSNYGLLNESAEHQQNHSAESTLIKSIAAKPQTPSTEKRNSSNNLVSGSFIPFKPVQQLETFTTSTITKQELIQIEKNTLKELTATQRAIEILDKDFVKETSSPLAYTKQMLIENKINNPSPFKQPVIVGKPTILRKDSSPKRQIENLIENRIIKDPIPLHVERRNSLHRDSLSPSRQSTTTVLNAGHSINTPTRQLHYDNQKPSSQLEFKLITPKCKPTTSKTETEPSTNSTFSPKTKQNQQSSTDQWINYKYLAAAGLATIIIYFLLIPFDFISLSLSTDDL